LVFERPRSLQGGLESLQGRIERDSNRDRFQWAMRLQQRSDRSGRLHAVFGLQGDLGVQRIFRLSERTGLRFRGEFFNLLNHPSFGSPTNLLTSALFGRCTETLANALGMGGQNGGFNPLYQIGGQRSIQLAMKLQF